MQVRKSQLSRLGELLNTKVDEVSLRDLLMEAYNNYYEHEMTELREGAKGMDEVLAARGSLEMLAMFRQILDILSGELNDTHLSRLQDIGYLVDRSGHA